LGEFNRSSQHLDSEELGWKQKDSEWIVRFVHEWFHRVGPVWECENIDNCSRRQLVVGYQVKRRQWRRVCRRQLDHVGSAKVVGCHQSVQSPGRYLSFVEREEIAILGARGCTIHDISRETNRSPSTISRELRRNASTRTGYLDYRASSAQWHAKQRARRPKTAKLASNAALQQNVQSRLAGMVTASSGITVPGSAVRWIGRRHGRRQDRRWATSWSPEQTAKRLLVDFPHDGSMRISHEAIYQALYGQNRGAPRRDLTACLRTGRALRVPRTRSRGRGKKLITSEIMISERPAESDDRAVPGHWEGDLIVGLDSSAIGTLVERTTRFTMLLHLPCVADHGQPVVKNGPPLAGHGAEAVRDAIAPSIVTFPHNCIDHSPGTKVRKWPNTPDFELTPD